VEKPEGTRKRAGEASGSVAPLLICKKGGGLTFLSGDPGGQGRNSGEGHRRTWAVEIKEGQTRRRHSNRPQGGVKGKKSLNTGLAPAGLKAERDY